jgi:opacity protein-like surface antigen
MKTTLAVATFAALVGVAGAANAADLYKGGSLKDAPVYVPPTTWTGFYLGGHVGGFWTDNKFNDDGYYDYRYSDTSWNNRVATSWNDNRDGVFGGGQLGYNYQTGAFVFGVEADFGVMDLNHTHDIYSNSSYSYWSKDDGNFYADVTGRLGYAAGPALFYAKGGWAYLDDKNSIGGTYTSHTNDWSVNHNSGLDGWVAGGGIEYMWSPSWSIKAEYLHFDFGKNTSSWTDTYCEPNKTWNFDRDLQLDTFKVGINYHFANNYAAPLK